MALVVMVLFLSGRGKVMVLLLRVTTVLPGRNTAAIIELRETGKRE
jgi:hypothetical protein